MSENTGSTSVDSYLECRSAPSDFRCRCCGAVERHQVSAIGEVSRRVLLAAGVSKTIISMNNSSIQVLGCVL
jgi:hypothetical protein